MANGRKTSSFRNIRTIMYYSGWMYVAFAHQIGKVIGMSSWNKVTDHDFLSVLLGNAVQKLNSVCDEEQSEAQLSLEDVVAFFQSLARLYLRYNALFTVEDVQELAPLKRVAFLFFFASTTVFGFVVSVGATSSAPGINIFVRILFPHSSRTMC